VRRIGWLLVLSFLLSGCATYKFQKGPAPYDKGYVASYDGKLIPEYTLGQANSVPDLILAKERFNRRRATVESYYKKMGQIEARFKELFWDPPAMVVDFIGGIFRWPFVAVADYKYNRNPQYKEKVDRLDEQKDELEKARVNDLKAKLKAYIDEDLVKEPAQKESPVIETLAAPVVKESSVAPVVEIPVVPVEPEKIQPAQVSTTSVAEAPVVAQPSAAPVEPEKIQPIAPEPEKKINVMEEVKPDVPPVSAPVVAPPQEIGPVMPKEEEKVAPIVESVKLEPPLAVIIAKPTKGLSPLQVNFNGLKSHSPAGKIVSYSWDFGDGDTSTKKNPINTYWSTTYGSRIFTATLTVKDDKGQTASTSINIEVLTN